MVAFPELIKAQLRGATIRMAPLVYFDFRSGPLGVWPGSNYIDIDGVRYHGLSNLGRMSQISSGPGGAIDEITLELSASPSMVKKMKDDSLEAIGRDCVAKFQFFDVRKFDEAGNYVDWEPLDDPWEFFWGKMGPLKLQFPTSRPGETPARLLSVNSLNALTNRSRPSIGYFSHRDQLARTGGTDNIFIRVSQMASTTVRWPNF